MLYRDILKDTEDNIVTAHFQIFMKDNQGEVFYSFEASVYDNLKELASSIEAGIEQEYIDIERTAEENLESAEESSIDIENDIESDIEKPILVTRRERRSCGNKYASVIASFLQ